MWSELTSQLNTRGVKIVKVVDISKLHMNENKGYKVGVLIAKQLSPSYIHQLSNSEEVIIDKTIFTETEREVDSIGEWVEGFFVSNGYKAFAQSEKNLLIKGFYTKEEKSTPLPHKKIAVMSGLGWIGKNNLLCTQNYGNALCMCSILTNAPIDTFTNQAMQTSKCGECKICGDVCPTVAITGVTWNISTHRDEIVDVHKCIGCLKCLVVCPWTQNYVRNQLNL